MSLQRQQQLSLVDGHDRDLGRVVIDRIDGDLVFGQFTPGPDYPRAERLFAEYVEAANEQLLSVVGELDAAIAALSLRLHSAEAAALPAIYDVQIGTGVITFRTHPPTDDPRSPEQPAAGGVPTPPIGPGVHSS